MNKPTRHYGFVENGSAKVAAGQAVGSDHTIVEPWL